MSRAVRVELDDGSLDALATTVDERLAEADRVLATDYPGDPGTRQPVHTVYVNADLAEASARPGRSGARRPARLLDVCRTQRDG